MVATPIVALLEARMSHELARLVEKHGGEALCVPALDDAHELGPERAEQLVAAIGGGTYEVAIFMTGVTVSALFEVAEKIGRRPELVAGLRALTTVCRGPKPTAALRGFGVTPTLSALESFTSAEVIDALATVQLKGRRVLLFHYGERSESLAETLLARRAVVDEQWLYRWRLPEDTSGLQRLVTAIIAGQVDALAVTCQIQIRHLFQVALAMGLERDLVSALNARTVVGAVGPVCRAVLETFGIEVHVVPEHPKMGPLVVLLMRYLERKALPRHPDGGAL
jgi:uroporphyrinogen-III synthase